MPNTSFWNATTSPISFPTLNQNIDVDIVIIGAGITGMTAAIQLISSGKKIAIIEADRVGGVTTRSSTGNLYTAVQPYYQTIVKKFNLETAKIIAHTRKFAIDYIERVVQEKKINCQFARRPWFVYTNDDKKLALLDKEAEIFKKMDLTYEEVTSLPLAFKFKKAFSMKNQARFHPYHYVLGLAEDLKAKGCLIYENSRIIHIQEKKDICLLETETGQKVSAKKIIIATHTPVGIHPVQLFTAPYRSYVVSGYLKDNHYPEGHFWDLDSPHHATCTHAVEGNTPGIVMVAGNHHKTGHKKNVQTHFKELATFLKQHLPISEIAYQWSAQHYHSADTVPYMGLASRFAKHTYIATGYFADGLVYGTIAGILLADLASNKDSAWQETYRATRLKLGASAGFLLKEDGDVLLQYYKDLPSFKNKNFDDIQPGFGKVVTVNREKWAVCLDENKKLHKVSAVCTHMKCIVNWNNAEKTWDCPCHGSRFSQEGKVLEGPAMQDLAKKE